MGKGRKADMLKKDPEGRNRTISRPQLSVTCFGQVSGFESDSCEACDGLFFHMTADAGQHHCQLDLMDIMFVLVSCVSLGQAVGSFTSGPPSLLVRRNTKNVLRGLKA